MSPEEAAVRAHARMRVLREVRNKVGGLRDPEVGEVMGLLTRLLADARVAAAEASLNRDRQKHCDVVDTIAQRMTE